MLKAQHTHDLAAKPETVSMKPPWSSWSRHPRTGGNLPDGSNAKEQKLLN